jgi:transketolase
MFSLQLPENSIEVRYHFIMAIKKSNNLSELSDSAKEVRREIFQFKTSSGFGHLASCLSVVDILVSIYLDKQSKYDIDHDRIIFSKGHGSPAAYPILASLGFFSKDELTKYCQESGILRLHADFTIPGCFFIGGSLGNGIGFAAGLALARPWQKFYVILGDAELYEGSVWESLMFINQHNLKNIILIVDRNSFGILGNTEDMIKLEPIEDKFQAFGIKTERVDGHDLSALRNCFSSSYERPQAIIADTVKGKGISFMENKYEYHTIIPSNPEQILTGLRELS